MKKTGKCPKCESRNLLGNVVITEVGQMNYTFFLRIRIPRRPKAIFFPKPVERPLLAWVCTDCGYTELYTHDPKALMEAFHENRANS